MMQTHPFTALPKDERRRFVQRYLRFLAERDGTPDFARRTLSRREASLAALAQDPVTRDGPPVLSQRAYEENAIERPVAREGLDDWALWAICLSKCSRMEEYAVRYLDASGRRRPERADDPYSLIDLEERYHGRLLASLLSVLGLTPGFRPPGAITRLTLRAILWLPRALSNLTVLCGEIIGVATFKLFLEKGRALCADQPRAQARLERLLQDILTDEVGHVLFLRSQLGPLRLLLARLLLPLVARVLIADYPEMRRLFGDRLLQEILSPRLLPSVLAEVGGLPLLLAAGRPADGSMGNGSMGDGATGDGLPDAAAGLEGA
jgi:hypothetical protein